MILNRSRFLTGLAIGTALGSGLAIGRYVIPSVPNLSTNKTYLDKIADTLNQIKVANGQENVIFTGKVASDEDIATILIFEGPCNFDEAGHLFGDTRLKASIAASKNQVHEVLPKLKPEVRKYLQETLFEELPVSNRIPIGDLKAL